MVTVKNADRTQKPAERAMARSVLYQFLSQGLTYPTEDIVTTLCTSDLTSARSAAAWLSADLSERLSSVEQELQPIDWTRLQAEHRRVFTHIQSADCPPCEGPYTSRHIFEETQELSDIAGFYRAFGMELAAKERPDHISVEMEFMHLLTYKEAHAWLHHGSEKARLCRTAERKFIQDHLGRWAPLFAEMLGKRAGGGYFSSIAGLTEAFISNEIAFLRVLPEKVKDEPIWPESETDDEVCPAADVRPAAE